jgi:hypothetical protein
MSVITTGAHPKALWPGVRKFVMGEYSEHPTEYTAIFDMKSSSMAYEEDVELTGFGLAPVKDQGAAVAYDAHTQGFTKRYTHVAYSLGYIVTREELDDNLYKSRSFKRGKMLAFSFRTTKEIVAANILNRGFSNSYVGGDGVELFSSAHPTLAGNQVNELAVPADLSEAALEDMLIGIEESKNSRGLQIAIRGEKLIVPPALGFTAERIMKSTLQNDTADNAVNAIRSRGLLRGGVHVNHYLTSDSAWFIKTDAPDGLMGFQRTGFEFSQDNDFDTMNAKAKGYERYVFGWTDWRGAWGSEGAA